MHGQKDQAAGRGPCADSDLKAPKIQVQKQHLDAVIPDLLPRPAGRTVTNWNTRCSTGQCIGDT